MRMIAAFALSFALALALSVSFSSEADAKKKASSGKNKACVGSTIDGKKVKFSCKATENCCFDGLMAKGNCTPKGQVCF